LGQHRRVRQGQGRWARRRAARISTSRLQWPTVRIRATLISQAFDETADLSTAARATPVRRHHADAVQMMGTVATMAKFRIKNRRGSGIRGMRPGGPDTGADLENASAIPAQSPGPDRFFRGGPGGGGFGGGEGAVSLSGGRPQHGAGRRPARGRLQGIDALMGDAAPDAANASTACS